MAPYRDPEDQKAAKAEWGRRKRLAEPDRGTRPLLPPLPTEFRLKSARDVLALIRSQVEAVIADPEISTLERARVCGFLAGVSLRAIQAGDLEARLEALETVLKLRQDRSDGQT